MDFSQISLKLWELITIYGLKVIAAAAILIIGRWASMGMRNIVRRVLLRGNVDPTVCSFGANLTYFALLIFFVLAALGQLGIQTTSFIAILGAAGLAIGLALQGSLANFAAGFLMIIFRPFRVGDYIEGAGVVGTVEEIQIFTTTLLTPDNKTIIVPNAKITGDNIINWTCKGTRRVDISIGIGYGDDIDTAKQVMREVMARDPRILADPPPQVALVELGESSVNFVVRPWVKSSDYGGVYCDTIENLKKALDAHGIRIPFPQRDVHVYQHAVVEEKADISAAA